MEPLCPFALNTDREKSNQTQVHSTKWTTAKMFAITVFKNISLLSSYMGCSTVPSTISGLITGSKPRFLAPMITAPLSSLHFLFHFCKNHQQAADSDDGCLMLILSSLTQGSGEQHVCGWMRLKGQQKAKKKKQKD